MNCQKEMGIFTIYDRGLRVMGKQKTNVDKEQIDENAEKKFNFYIGSVNIIYTLIAIIVVVVGVASYIITTNVSQSKDIESLQKDSEKINVAVKDLEKSFDDIEDISEDDHAILVELNSIIKEQPAYFLMSNAGDFIETETVNDEIFISELNVEDGTDILFQEVNGETVYSMEDLYNVPIITSYIENGKEVYFCGKFNENKNWNGKCVLNIYNGDKLYSIFEGVYDDGNLFSYKCMTEDDGRWIINDRIVHSEYNDGETYIYKKTSDFTKNFTLDNVREKQILDIDNFLLSKKESLLSFYKGNTVNGKYNDDSGRAYLVKYKEDGTVNYLYCGNLSNGEENDKTGNAWCIGWGYANDGYHYYKGTFTDGQQDKKPKSWYKPMTQEEIDAIVNQEDFDFELTGLLPKDA